MIPENAIFNVTDEFDNNDGTSTLVLDVNDEFKKWFKDKSGWKRWSAMEFEKFVASAIESYLSSEKPIDVAIKNCTCEYEEEIDLYTTYGGD